jgi:hypothetical protein
VRLITSLQIGAKYLGCVVCRFHIDVGTGSAPCQKPVSIELLKWFLSPTGRLNFGFITEGKLTVVLITPYSWGSQLVVNTMHHMPGWGITARAISIDSAAIVIVVAPPMMRRD